jgi:hypothetical protein
MSSESKSSSQAEEKVLADLANRTVKFKSLKDRKAAGFPLYKNKIRPDRVLIDIIWMTYPVKTWDKKSTIREPKELKAVHSYELMDPEINIGTLVDLCKKELNIDLLFCLSSKTYKSSTFIQPNYYCVLTSRITMRQIHGLNQELFIFMDDSSRASEACRFFTFLFL